MSKKRVKIWFDDEGEPHETIVDETDPDAVLPEDKTPVNATMPGPGNSRVWFDDEGEPHEEPLAGAGNKPSTRLDLKASVWFDDEGEPHDSPQAAAAANLRAQQGERTQVSAPPQTHSAFTQGLTPKPMYFERVETRRSEAGPQPNEVAARPRAPESQARPDGAPQTHTQAPARVPAPPAAPRATSPAATPPMAPGGPRPTPRPTSAAPSQQPVRATVRETQPRPGVAPGTGGWPQPQQPMAEERTTVALPPDAGHLAGQERTVVAHPPQGQGAVHPAVIPQHRPGSSTSLASNYRAAVAHAAMMDASAKSTGRVETQDRRVAPQAPLIGVEQDYTERTVATAAPTAAPFASTLTPVSGRPSVAQPAPVVARPTLTHTPVPMDDRAHQPTQRASGGFFNRGPEAAPSSGGFFNRAAEPPMAPQQEQQQPRQQPQARRLTDPIAAPQKATPAPKPAAPRPTAPIPAPLPAQAQPTVIAPAPQARAPAAPETVHNQATVVRESPFLHSEPTVVRNPVSEEQEPAPMRRRLTEPLLARGSGFVAPAHQDIPTERAPLWRLAIATWIDAAIAMMVGASAAAAEMLMFGGHWPAEATNPLDALAMWMHNYPGTERRAVLVMMLFAWAYAAVGARMGRTPGRMIMRLIVIGQDGTMIPWSKAALRGLVSILSGLCFGAGYFWAIVDGQHRAVHDILSRSVVVARKSS